MALSGDEQDVAAPEVRDGLADRFRAIADFGRARRIGENGRADCGWILAARIVVGHDNLVRAFGGDAAHDRALAAVAVAAGAEDYGQLAFCVRAQAPQRFLERVRLVRIVDKDGRAATVADKLEPTLCAGEM